MSGLEQLVSDAQKRPEIEDFVKRFEQGHPSEGISDDEAQKHHEQIAAKATPHQYEQAAKETFERFSPEEREQFGKQVTEQAEKQNVVVPKAGTGNGAPKDAGSLAQIVTALQKQQPGLLGQLLGGGGGGSRSSALSSPLAKAALGGIAAMVAKQVMAKR